MKRALIIQHAAAEPLGSNFTGVLKSRGFTLETLPLFQGAPGYVEFSPPSLDSIALVVALGGPLSANDDFPAIRLEQAYLARAMSQGMPVLGICLGAQLMAVALGGSVEPTGGYQFGLRKIDVTPEGDADPVFGRITVPLVPTLHGERFSLPSGAVKLAEGFMLCRNGEYRKINMAFRHGNSYGFQFEPHLTLEDLRVWNRDLFDDYRLMGERFNPEEEAARNLREFAKYSEHYQSQMRDLFTAFLENADLADP